MSHVLVGYGLTYHSSVKPSVKCNRRKKLNYPIYCCPGNSSVRPFRTTPSRGNLFRALGVTNKEKKWREEFFNRCNLNKKDWKETDRKEVGNFGRIELLPEICPPPGRLFLGTLENYFSRRVHILSSQTFAFPVYFSRFRFCCLEIQKLYLTSQDVVKIRS